MMIQLKQSQFMKNWSVKRCLFQFSVAFIAISRLYSLLMIFCRYRLLYVTFLKRTWDIRCKTVGWQGSTRWDLHRKRFFESGLIKQNFVRFNQVVNLVKIYLTSFMDNLQSL